MILLHGCILFWLLAIFGPIEEVQFRTDAESQQMLSDVYLLHTCDWEYERAQGPLR